MLNYTPPAREPWHDEAVCAQIGMEIFFPSDYTESNNAFRYDEPRTVCRSCPVWRECLIDDLETSEFIQLDNGTLVIPDGMRGGLSPRERYILITRSRSIGSKRPDITKKEVARQLVNDYSQEELRHHCRNHTIAREMTIEAVLDTTSTKE